jgi:hypothetical protein
MLDMRRSYALVILFWALQLAALFVLQHYFALD